MRLDNASTVATIFVFARASCLPCCLPLFCYCVSHTLVFYEVNGFRSVLMSVIFKILWDWFTNGTEKNSPIVASFSFLFKHVIQLYVSWHCTYWLHAHLTYLVACGVVQRKSRTRFLVCLLVSP